jgi:1-acyl-sn-glycerol-3-phosphate acyltransferase
MTAAGDDRLDARAPEVIAAAMPLARALCRRYFRLRVEGLEHLPEGPALLVGNHNNGLAGPDILCTLSTLWDARGPDAPLYALAHDFAMRHVTVFGAVISRFGALRASRDNALHALAAGAQVLVYPGGDLEAYRHFRRRDEIVLGPRTGFVTIAREAGVPIVPVVSQGAHRSAVVFHEGEGLARALRLKRWARLERFPLALALPWGLAAGPWLPWLPLPLPIRLRFLPPRRVAAHEDPAAVRESVRASMQTALDAMAGARP